MPPGGVLTGKLNGGPFALDRPGTAVLTAPVDMADGVLTLEIEAASPETAAILDTQRQYGRSRRDGTVLPGEYIVRLNIPKEK